MTMMQNGQPVTINTIKKKCPKCRATKRQVQVMETSDGEIEVGTYCTSCGYFHRDYYFK